MIYEWKNKSQAILYSYTRIHNRISKIGAIVKTNSEEEMLNGEYLMKYISRNVEYPIKTEFLNKEKSGFTLESEIFAGERFRFESTKNRLKFEEIIFSFYNYYNMPLGYIKVKKEAAELAIESYFPSRGIPHGFPKKYALNKTNDEAIIFFEKNCLTNDKYYLEFRNEGIYINANYVRE